MESVQQLVSSLARHFSSREWCVRPGTGQAIRQDNNIYLTPDNLPLDNLQTQDIFVLEQELDKQGETVPVKIPENKLALKQSAFAKLYLNIFKGRGCGSVVYCQPRCAVLVTMMNDKQFVMKEQEMISTIMDPVRKMPLGWEDEVVVPIIDNTDDLVEMNKNINIACQETKDTNAVLIKNNGIIVWGENWIQTRNMLDSYIYLMELALDMKKLGLNQNSARNTKKISSEKIGNIPSIEGRSQTEKEKREKKTKKVEETQRVVPKLTKRDGTVTNTGAPPHMRRNVSARPAAVVDLALKKKKAALSRLRQNLGNDQAGPSVVNRGIRSTNIGTMGPTGNNMNMMASKFGSNTNEMGQRMNNIGSHMITGPSHNNMGPHVNHMGTHMNNMGSNMNNIVANVTNIGPNVNNMGPGVNNLGSHVSNMGPNVNNMGPNVNNMGPHVNNMGPKVNNMSHMNSIGPGRNTMMSPVVQGSMNMKPSQMPMGMNHSAILGPPPGAGHRMMDTIQPQERFNNFHNVEGGGGGWRSGRMENMRTEQRAIAGGRGGGPGRVPDVGRVGPGRQSTERSVRGARAASRGSRFSPKDKGSSTRSKPKPTESQMNPEDY